MLFDKNIFQSLIVLTSSLSLTGCAGTYIESHIQSFSAIDDISKNDKIYVSSLHSNKHQELERESWVSLIDSELVQKGYTIVNDIKKSTALLIVGFDIDNGITRQYSYSIPQYGVVGTSGSTTTGSATTFGNTTTYNSYTNNTPQYGITGYNNGIGYATTFNRLGLIQGFRRGDSKPRVIYSSQLSSTGSCGILPSVTPILTHALMQNFPKAGTYVIRMKMDKGC